MIYGVASATWKRLDAACRIISDKFNNALRPKHPRAFPCKRHMYDRRPTDDGRPFREEYDRLDAGFRLQRGLANLVKKKREGRKVHG